MNEAQERLFNLLIEIDDLCSQHNIDYCLAGGSALGAIRNQCFLPWDDDIDLYITRDNWNKLFDVISKNPELLPENRDLVCIENSKYYRNPIARYIDILNKMDSDYVQKTETNNTTTVLTNLDTDTLKQLIK